MRNVYYAEINGKYELCSYTLKELVEKLEPFVYYGAMAFIKHETPDCKTSNVVAYNPNGFSGALCITKSNYEYYRKYYKVEE